MLVTKVFNRIFTSSLKQHLCFSNFKHIEEKSQRAHLNKLQRIKLAAAYRALDEYGLNEGICNHLTAIAPAVDNVDDVMLVIPYGLLWREVTPSLLVAVNEQNEIVEGTGEPELTALCIHKGIYMERPDAQSVMHTHMPHATVLGCLEDPKLCMLHQNSARFFNRIAYDKSYEGLGNNLEEGQRMGKVLGKRDVLIMSNHGVMTVAQSIAIAFDNMYYLERAAMIQILAYNSGQKFREIPSSLIQITENQLWESMEKYATAHLNAFIKRLQSSDSNFAA